MYNFQEVCECKGYIRNTNAPRGMVGATLAVALVSLKHLLRTLILLFVRLVGAPSAWAASRKARKPVPAAPRILLIRPDHLGDLVLTTPVLRALKTHIPAAHITVMVGPWSSEVVARHPDIDRLLARPFPGFQRIPQKPLTPYILLFSVAQQLARGNYDLAINLRPDFWWGAALLYLARIPRRVGYAIKPGTPFGFLPSQWNDNGSNAAGRKAWGWEEGRWFLTHALPFRSPEPVTVSCLRLISAGLAALGYPPLEEPYTPERYPLVFVPTREEQEWVTERLSEEGINAETPVVVIHPGSGAAVKLWRTEAWATCANSFTTSLTSPAPVRIILTGSKSERSMLEEIARGMTSPPLLLMGTTVGQLAALLQRARLVLGVDSGPLHLAVAEGTPTVQIFGPTDPRIFGPWGSRERHIVIASTQRCPTCPCIPCGRLDFRPEELAAHPCVRLVPEQQVQEAIASVWPVEKYVTKSTTTE